MADSSGWDLFFTSDDPIATAIASTGYAPSTKSSNCCFGPSRQCLVNFWMRAFPIRLALKCGMRYSIATSSLISILARKDTAIACLTLRYSKPIESAAASATEVLEAIARESLKFSGKRKRMPVGRHDQGQLIAPR